jgi:UTP--glucose-1-phosphate uridylyltransferase
MQETKPAQGTIRKAVIPAAGLGTRMLPITRSVPKEMLPVGRKPMIQHVLEEAVLSGLEQVCIVIREGKEIIKDYFCQRRHASLDRCDANMEELERLVASCELTFIYQPQPRGLGNALLQASPFVGDESFVMMIPDQLMLAHIPATLQLIRDSQPGSFIRSGLLRLAKAELPFFAGARGVEIESRSDEGEYAISRLQTEEETRATYSDAAFELRGFGRTVYPPEIFDYLGEDYINPRTGEVDLWKTFAASAGIIEHRGRLLEGEPLDLGTFEGYYHYLPRFVGVAKL